MSSIGGAGVPITQRVPGAEAPRKGFWGAGAKRSAITFAAVLC
jgi:hypothetical protein